MQSQGDDEAVRHDDDNRAEQAIGQEGSLTDGSAEARDGRRRGRGRGRDRAPRDEDGQAPQNADSAGVAESALASDDSVVAEAMQLTRTPAPDFAEASATSPGAATAEDPSEAIAADELPIAAAAPVSRLMAEPAARYALPVDSLQAVAEEAGLQWVGSDASKVRAAQEAMAATPAPKPVPREIKRVEHVEEGALVLVETRKDLAQVKLPFEAAGQEPAGRS